MMGATPRRRTRRRPWREAMEGTAQLTRNQAQVAYRDVRRTTLGLCEPLEIEDHVVQSMPDASPPKWHLGHTTWFFETFILAEFVPGYRPVHSLYRVLFNSYYVTVGERHPRPERGLLSRPSLGEVLDYRHRVDESILELLATMQAGFHPEIVRRLVLGLHHEQQHQELLLMDTKHLFSVNPLRPAYQRAPAASRAAATDQRWVEFPGGVHEFGHAGDGFAYDNEMPRHRVVLEPFALASRCVTNGEYLEFMADGGYERPELWLYDGWGTVEHAGWRAPLYWERIDADWHQFTLGGLRRVDPAEPVVHLSFFEADAYARWRECRLPSEFEWEQAAGALPRRGNFQESGTLHPVPASGTGLEHIFGNVWELTRSDYAPYPGYRPLQGALGEYNGKFMSGQLVQRGGSCLTPASHIRATYRNFFYPHQRWNFQGVRLARDVREG